MRPGIPGYRVRLPEVVHPISAGVKGGIIGGLVMPLRAFLYGLSTGHGIWYPVNLLAGMVLPVVATMTTPIGFPAYRLLPDGLVIHTIMFAGSSPATRCERFPVNATRLATFHNPLRQPWDGHDSCPL